MSNEVSITAIVQPAAGKLDRLKEFISAAIAWIQANEPDTLEFSLWECETDDGVKLSMFERYRSQAALDKHEGSEHYKEVMSSMLEEQLVAEPPMIMKGKHVAAFFR